MELILTNSVKYNGQDSSFTQKAQTLIEVCRESLDEVKLLINTLLMVHSLHRIELTSLLTVYVVLPLFKG